MNKINKIITLTAGEAAWYGYNGVCALIRFDGFAPIGNYAAIVDGKYTNNPETGYIHGNGNTGTASMIFQLDKIHIFTNNSITEAVPVLD